MSNLDKFVLKFERIKGDLGGIRQKLTSKIKPQKHPFLKEQRLVKNWGDKLSKDREKVPKTKRRQTKKAR